MANDRIVPINRSNKFFSGDDFDLDISMGREAIEGDGNFVVILYKVDRALTESSDIYGEASKDGIRYFPPIELVVSPTIEEAENKAYNTSDGNLRNLQDGKFIFDIYSAQLTELKTDIKFGDYIGYQISETQIRYYSVVNDGAKNFDNTHTILGYKGAFRTITCSPVDETEFKGY